ncbi:MAG: FAD-binding domain-containing protein [Pseudomonadota bacterium]
MFDPSRHAALQHLERFAPNAGKAYAAKRNFDFGPDDRGNVSMLSPWVRHRLISEAEVASVALRHHSFSASEKFVQEVFWRSYFKGWLEHRPQVWDSYVHDLDAALARLEKDDDLKARYDRAIAGETDIECFDFWARELVETGYLHNHARMWFASIWIFTLRLPWALGADFFYRHLLDGDPASNTCSWRWVGGLHTKGKHYVARASNIERFTNGRFNPAGQLDKNPAALFEEEDLDISPMPVGDRCPDKPYALLVTEEDCLPETLPLEKPPQFVLGVSLATKRSPAGASERVEAFSKGAIADALARAGEAFGCGVETIDAGNLTTRLQQLELETLVSAFIPVGSTRDALFPGFSQMRAQGIEVRQLLRDHDRLSWPHATRGFFKLKEKIPKLATELNLG